MLRIVEPGIMNTVQDAGRWGYQAYGVPVSGAMDLVSLRAANDLVFNPSDEAALEIHSPLSLQAGESCLMAVTGAEALIEVNGRSVPEWTSLFVRRGSLVEIRLRAGGWSYLAVHGGIDVPAVLGSKSTYVRGEFGGLQGRAFQSGDEVPVGRGSLTEPVSGAGRRASDERRGKIRGNRPVRVLLGPHQDAFTDEAIAALTRTDYRVTEAADRMGYRLQGAILARRRQGELVSCGVPLGALQVPPDGQPIVLMADHQTTGGYPIIATVVSEDIPLIAQRAVGESVTFHVVEAAFI
ncbi:MAG: biotin-dependent carboxyltransferase family protein [Chloroflexi bacterium]|nr:biotin-dependent carboxyltransferase family protein [Chloroflexota bacterium]